MFERQPLTKSKITIVIKTTRMWFDNTTDMATKRRPNERFLLNGHKGVDITIFFKFKDGSRTRRPKAAAVKEQRRLDMRNINSHRGRKNYESNKSSNDCVNANKVNMSENNIYA